MKLTTYDHKLVRIVDDGGKAFTGAADVFSSGYGLHEYGEEMEGVHINGFVLFADQIAKIEALPHYAVHRAAETWQRAGAYYVRVQAMAKKHGIPLRQEFDAHDGPDTKYILVTDHDFPIATARMYPLDNESVMIGRVVVVPEYRRLGIGTLVVTECECWAEELGYARAVLESRDNKTAFYLQLGYEICGEASQGDTFRCVRMEKAL